MAARGFTQVQGFDFNEVFYPVVRHTSIRILLAITAQLDLYLEQMDITTAFLHGDLKERILMDQPKGFKVKGEVEKACLLRKSLYGLKQSPRQWYRKFDSVMLGQGYFRSSDDCCIYFKYISSSISIYFMLCVDEMLIASQSTQEIQLLMKKLRAEFEMKELGEARKILGMEITRDKHHRKIYLS